MSICWNCTKNNSCAKLYYEGEQQQCEERDSAYQSKENYLRWLAKASGFNADYLQYRSNK